MALDIAIRPRPTETMEPEERERFGSDFGFGYIEAGVEVSPTTREAIWRDGWAQMVGAGTNVCTAVAEFEGEAPQDLSEDDLLALNEQARLLARSTQTLLAIAREDKGR